MGKRVIIYFAGIFMLGIFGSLFNIFISSTVGQLCDMARTGDGSGLSRMLVINLSAGILAISINKVGSILYSDESKRVGMEISNAVYSKSMRLPISYYDEHHSGEFMSKIIWDTQRSCDIFGSRLRRIIMPVLTVVVYAIPMFMLCPPVMTGLFIVSCVELAVHFLMIAPMKKVGKNVAASNQEMAARLSDMLQGIEVIKMFPVKERILNRYDDANEAFAKAQNRQADYAALMGGLNTIFELIGSFWFLALGIWYTTAYHGQIGSLISLYLLYGSFNWNFLQIGQYVTDLANCLVNGERILEFLELDEEPETYEEFDWEAEKEQEAQEREKEQGREKLEREEIRSKEISGEQTGRSAAVKVSHLTFAYQEALGNVLENYSATFEKGVCTAITGVSGIGKSTLSKLILGFYKAHSGRIYVCGKSLREIGLWGLREHIAYVPQEPYLYNVSIAENIRYGKPSATDEEIIAAAKAAYAHDFIMKQEKGYETVTGERGVRLSGGEKQRIAIARAILKDAPILLLDEATSALDNESEYLVAEAVRNLKNKKTIIMIAHRPSTIAMADKVVEM